MAGMLVPWATAAQRADAREAVRGPGKFEGEPATTPLLYALMLDGWDDAASDGVGGDWVVRLGRVVLFGDDSRGFVNSAVYRTVDLAVWRFGMLRLAIEGDPDDGD